MSFSFDPDVEMQDPEWQPAKVAKTANFAAETAGTSDKLATLAISRPQNSKSEGPPGVEVDYPPSAPGTFLEADERCPEAMAKPGPLWGRVAIATPGGQDTPSGWTLADWQAYAERYHGPGCTLTPIAGLPKPRAPANLDEALAAACEGVAGITQAQFRALLSHEDIADIEAGDIPVETLRGYAESCAEGIRSGRIVVREGAESNPASGSIVITDGEIDAARRGRTVR